MKLFTSDGKRNARTVKLATIGLTLLMVSALTLIADPVQRIANWQMALKPGTIFYHLWLKPPIDVYISVYMFNITNAEAYLAGEDSKMQLEQVGPYVYQEFLENIDVHFNDNNTITYTPARYVQFIPERSKGDPKVDRIIATNVPYLGISSVASSFSFLAAYGLSAIARRLDATPIVDKSVHEYLWGYDDPLVRLASKLIPSVFDFERFGIMDRILNEGENNITMQLPHPVTDKMKPEDAAAMVNERIRGFAIDNYNGEKGLKHWDYKDHGNNTACNKLRGVFDGTLYPRDLQKGESFNLYRKAFCRTLPIMYSHEERIKGIQGYAFSLKADAFETSVDNPETSCFCKGRKCLKSGLSSVSPCYYNMPIAISFPHFYHGDPSLLTSFEGLDPNEKAHGSEVVVQPTLGVPMRVHLRFQVNLQVGDVRGDMARFRNKVVPIFWAEIGIEELSSTLMVLLDALFTYCPVAQLCLCLLLIIFGIALVGKALLLHFSMPAVWNQLPIINTMDGSAGEMTLTMKNVWLLKQAHVTPAELKRKTLRKGKPHIKPHNKDKMASELLPLREADESPSPTTEKQEKLAFIV